MVLFSAGICPAENTFVIPTGPLSNDSVLALFREQFGKMEALLAQPYDSRPPMIVFEGELPHTLDSLYSQKEQHERKAFRARNGLELTGQAYHRFDRQVWGIDEDDDIYRTYTDKLQVELGWNFFNSGFFQRKSHYNLIAKRTLAERMQQDSKLANNVWHGVEERSTLTYQSLLSAVMYQRLENLELLSAAYSYILDQGRSTGDKLLEVMSDKMDLEYKLMQMGNPDSLKGRGVTLLRPTLLQADTAAIFHAITRNSSLIQQSVAKREMLQAERKMTSYWQTVRLTPFLRLSQYYRTVEHIEPLQAHWDAGVRFTLPLFSQSASKRRVIDREMQLVEVDCGAVEQEVRQHVEYYHNLIQKLNTAIASEAHHAKEVKKYIAARNISYSKADQGYNYMLRLMEYNEYLKSLERMYQLMMTRNMHLIQLQRQSGYIDIEEVVADIDID